MSFGCSCLAVTTSTEAVKPKYGVNFSAVGCFSFFDGDDFGGGGKTKIWRYRHISVSPHQSGNFAAGKCPSSLTDFSGK